jgi:eukaryotic-like serine/threonine-protein kinase
MALSTGSLLADRYEITAPIATGGMGEVWKARDRVLDRIVAAKVLRSEYTGDPNFLARFRNEARHTAALTHPNIASVYDYGETVDESGHQQLAFLVMEFVEGQPLVTILHEEGQLPVDWTLHVLSQSADGLSAAHRAGVVHRDIKPGNLMVRPDGVVKLTDFGIAQARDATPLTRTGMVVGTAQYLSPEQAQGMEVTAASDVYSLGVVAYECLAGARPFDGASQVAIALAHINRPPPPLPAHVPPAVRLLVERALAKDPADRFPDGGAFAEAIRRVAAGGSLTAGSPVTAPTPAVADPAADGRTQVFGAATGAAVAAAAAAGVAGAATGAHAAPPTGPAGPMPPLQAPDAGPMPPLQAPDDDDWGPEDEEPPAGGRRRALLIAAAVIVLLLLAGGTWFLLSPAGDGGKDAGSTTAPSTSTTAGAVTIDLAAYLGRGADQVQVELEALGFTVTQADASETTVAEGSELAGRPLAVGEVADISPAGENVPTTAAVTIYAVPEAETGGEETEPQTTETTTSSPETTSSAPTTTSEAPTTTEETVPTTTEPSLPGSEPPPTTDPPPTTAGEPTDVGAADPDGTG